MDSRLVFAVVLLWGICACAAANPFPFQLPAPAVTFPISPSNGTCSATYSCAGEDDDCSGDQYNGCTSQNGSCCAMGLYCVSGSCAVDNTGTSCNQTGVTKQCFSAYGAAGPIECVGSPLTCQYVYGPGDNCAATANCMYGLTCNSDGVCQGIGFNMPCNSTNQCTYGSTCQMGKVNGTNSTELVCLASLASGAKCTVGAAGAQCITGTVCFSGTCTTMYSLGAGAKCAPGLCGEDLTCAANNLTCVATTDDLTSCTTKADCNNQTCWCSSYTGNSYCNPPSTYDPCSGEGSDLIQCQMENNCTDLYVSPDSCVYNNCYSDLKKMQSCGCDGSDDLVGGCAYNSFCGGFPVWAIIVIIIVAIVLVLAIVLLVFFMMRRRRVYDSI